MPPAARVSASTETSMVVLPLVPVTADQGQTRRRAVQSDWPRAAPAPPPPRPRARSRRRTAPIIRRRILGDDGDDRAALARARRESVAVDGLPARGHEQIAGPHRARVVAHLGDVERERIIGRAAGQTAGRPPADSERTATPAGARLRRMTHARCNQAAAASTVAAVSSRVGWSTLVRVMVVHVVHHSPGRCERDLADRAAPGRARTRRLRRRHDRAASPPAAAPPCAPLAAPPPGSCR